MSCVFAALALAGAFAVAGPALAQLGATVNEGLAYGTVVGWGTQDLRVTIMRIIQVLFGFLGVVAVLIILYAGWRWMTSAGDPQKIDEAKRTLVNATLGLLVIFMAFAIVSFVIRALSDAAGPQGVTRRPPPTLPCTNCDALGAGIIEAVYPAPGAVDVPRNTLIFVTFKVLMDRGTLLMNIGGADKISDQILIRAFDQNNVLLPPIPPADVNASSNDNLTFTFDPLPYLGDGVRDVRYQVDLGCGIKRQDGQNAFTCAGGTGFAWRFTVGTRLDLTPPTLETVFPRPDDTGDTYSAVLALQSQGAIKVTGRPRTFQASRVEGLTVTAGSSVTFASSAYNCSQEAVICVSYNGTNFSLAPKEINTNFPAPGCTAASLSDRSGWLPDSTLRLDGNSLTLGCGVKLNFTDLVGNPLAAGNQWHFRAFAAQSPDTLQIGQAPLYTFVEDTTAGTNIAVGKLEAPKTNTQIATEIKNALDAPPQSPDVSAKIDDAPPIDNTQVVLTARVAGTAGNNIRITPSGGWATVDAFGGGQDAGFQQTTGGGGGRDVARNATPRLDFSETMFPLPVSGNVTIDDNGDGAPGNGVGTLLAGPRVTVQADMDGDSNFDADEHVGGAFIVSNVYQTTEFQSGLLCGTCSTNGLSCTSDVDCGAGTCQPIRNSCGDQIYCLPTRNPTAIPGGVTQYRIQVDAASLATCAAPADCTEPSFPDCGGGPPTVCRNIALNLNYPQASAANDGAMDAARNSLDGNRVGGAQGPLPPPDSYYRLNSPLISTKGDSVEWTFWVNNRIELKPPSIQIDVTPPVSPDDDGASPNMDIAGTNPGVGLPITIVPSAQFDKVLLSSSLKPDNRYRDGRCGCDPAQPPPGDCRSGEICDPDSGTCRSQSGADNYCAESRECQNGNQCQTRQHVTLVDHACSTGGRCSGWWITNVGHDTSVPPDGYPDFSAVAISHTPLAEYSRYGVEMGSGIKDLYQNCYLPSEGPDAGGASCNTNRVNKYCCNGAAQATPCTP